MLRWSICITLYLQRFLLCILQLRTLFTDKVASYSQTARPSFPDGEFLDISHTQSCEMLITIDFPFVQSCDIQPPMTVLYLVTLPSCFTRWCSLTPTTPTLLSPICLLIWHSQPLKQIIGHRHLWCAWSIPRIGHARLVWQCNSGITYYSICQCL